MPKEEKMVKMPPIVVTEKYEKIGRKIIFAIMAYDREPYFTSLIRNIYDYAKKIVVVEGYEPMYWDLEGCDWTRKQIKKWDKDSRIAYKNIGKVQSSSTDPTWHKNEIMQTVIEEVGRVADEGDWVIVLGADELWKHETLDFISSLSDDVFWVGVPFDNFVGDFYHIVSKDKEVIEKIKNDESVRKFYDRYGNFMINGLYHERAFRFFKGHNFITNHTAVKDKVGRYLYADPSYQQSRVLLPLDSDLRWVHYGYVGEMDWILRKIVYHYKRLILHKRGGKIDEEDKYQSMYLSGEWFFWNEGLYRWIFHGWCRQNPAYRIVKVSDGYEHPYPMEEHPYFGRSRQEIAFGLQSIKEDEPVFDKPYKVGFDRKIGYYLDE